LGWWIHNGLNALMRHQNNSAVEVALRGLEPQILAQVHNCRGVMLRLEYWKWAHADPTGRVVRQFKWASIVGSGLFPKQVYDAFQRRDRIEQSPPRGWVKENIFVWVTEGDIRNDQLRGIH
jgi:hypothetical protein